MNRIYSIVLTLGGCHHVYKTKTREGHEKNYRICDADYDTYCHPYTQLDISEIKLILANLSNHGRKICLKCLAKIYKDSEQE